MNQPTFKEILETAIELAHDEGSTSIARSLEQYHKDPGPKHVERYNQLIDKACWVLKERTNSIHELVRA